MKRQAWCSPLLAVGMAMGLSLAPPAPAETKLWQADATVYGYGSHLWANHHSLLNPNNTFGLPEQSWHHEWRANLSLNLPEVRLSARPVLQLQASETTQGQNEYRQRQDAAYLSQWQLRWRPDPSWSLSVGRELLNWGPGQFRSPSSPFYFNNGRNNPMAELAGVDTAQVRWTPNINHNLALAYVRGQSRDTPPSVGSDPWRHSALLKWNSLGENWSSGLLWAQAEGQPAFIGWHGQISANDAWLVYAEANSQRPAQVLMPNPHAALPLQLQAAPRRSDLLIGAAYTLDNGQTVQAEYLYHGHGYTRTQAQSLLLAAEQAPSLAGWVGLAAPSLLNRHYLHLVWQSNLLEESGYARVMYSQNLQDGSGQLSTYLERKGPYDLTLFALAAINHGGSRREYASVWQQSCTLGLKWALP